MKEALMNLLSKMDGHDVVIALAIATGAGITALGLTYTYGYELVVNNQGLTLCKSLTPSFTVSASQSIK